MTSRVKTKLRLPDVPRGPSTRTRLRNLINALWACRENAWFVATVAGIIAIVIAASVFHVG